MMKLVIALCLPALARRLFSNTYNTFIKLLGVPTARVIHYDAKWIRSGLYCPDAIHEPLCRLLAR